MDKIEILVIFILSSFATYRLSLMFAKESGPCGIFETIRNIPKKDGCWYLGIRCPLCNSVWWAGLISLWLTAVGVIPWQLSLVNWLGVSGLSIILYENGPKIE